MDPAAYPLHAEVERRHWWFVARRRILAKVMSTLALPANARLLEFGSGTGGNLGMLSRFGAVTAVEIEDLARDLSLDQYPNVRHVRSLDEAVGPFEAAVLFDVLEHLDEPVAVLERIRARLASSGHLVITVPAHAWLYGKHDRFLHHRRRYSRALLRRHLEGGGFALQRLSPMNSALFPLVAGARVAEALEAWLRGPRTAARGMTVPPAPINRALTELFGAERHLLPERTLPFGVSLLAVATARG